MTLQIIPYKFSFVQKNLPRKGLSHEIDLKNVDKNLQNLAEVRDVAGFKILRSSDVFIMQKVYLLQLMPVWVGLMLLVGQ
jgi:hypothetical protein